MLRERLHSEGLRIPGFGAKGSRSTSASARRTSPRNAARLTGGSSSVIIRKIDILSGSGADALFSAEAPHMIALDVTNAAAVQRAAEETARTLGRIDILSGSESRRRLLPWDRTTRS